MLAHILLAAALATASPAPTASPALKTIATLRASAQCAEIVTHANSAIASTLDDNSVISQTITQLRMVNLDDGNLLHRNAGVNALRDLAASLYKQSESGDGEIKRLRALAAKSTDPQEAKDLKSFADALGGALGRQLKMARDMNGFLAYVDYSDMDGLGDDGSATGEGVFEDDPYAPPAARNKNSATAYAQNAARDFQDRLPLIYRDESRASTYVEGALSGC